MNASIDEIEKMLEELGLYRMSTRLKELWSSPDYSKEDTLQVLSDVVSAEYVGFVNARYERNIRLSRLSGHAGDIRNLYTHDGRVYTTENAMKQITSLSFMKNGTNVSIFGETDAGKSYALTSIGIEACRLGYRVHYVDFLDLLDDLSIWREKGIQEYKKKINYLVRMPILLIDDFLTCSDERRLSGFTNIFDLIKKRDERGNSTIIATQYAPDEWPQLVCGDIKTAGEIDAVRRRLIERAIIVSIEIAKS